MSLLERTRTGLKELPSNAAWLVSRALRPLDSIEETVAGARDQGRRIEAAVIDAAPLGGDSVETRIRRAQEAAERAREAPGGGAFVRQLCWRDFHHQLLAAEPRIARDDLHPRNDRWRADPPALASWTA